MLFFANLRDDGLMTIVQAVFYQILPSFYLFRLYLYICVFQTVILFGQSVTFENDHAGCCNIDVNGIEQSCAGQIDRSRNKH